MQALQIIFGVILIASALFLVVAVLMQHGKSHNLSGTIAGGAETFFGKSKAQTIDKKLDKITIVVAIVFVVLVIAVYAIQPETDIGISGIDSSVTSESLENTESIADTESAEDTESIADTESVEDTESVADTESVENTDKSDDTAG